MWRLVGRLLSWLLAPFLRARSRRPGTTNARPDKPPSNAKRQPASSQLYTWQPSAGWWRSSSRAPRRERRPALQSPLLRLWLIALCLLSLPSCSTLRPPPAAPAVVPCPLVDCLDKLTQVCEGIDPPPARTCADVYVHAVDAGAALNTCQVAQHELIACIRRHNAKLNQEPDP